MGRHRGRRGRSRRGDYFPIAGKKGGKKRRKSDITPFLRGHNGGKEEARFRVFFSPRQKRGPSRGFSFAPSCTLRRTAHSTAGGGWERGGGGQAVLTWNCFITKKIRRRRKKMKRMRRLQPTNTKAPLHISPPLPPFSTQGHERRSRRKRGEGRRDNDPRQTLTLIALFSPPVVLYCFLAPYLAFLHPPRPYSLFYFYDTFCLFVRHGTSETLARRYLPIAQCF